MSGQWQRKSDSNTEAARSFRNAALVTISGAPFLTTLHSTDSAMKNTGGKLVQKIGTIANYKLERHLCSNVRKINDVKFSKKIQRTTKH